MYKYANSRSLQGLQRAELSGTLIQKQTQGGSSTYVLHRPGRAQEDHQLLREESERRDSFGMRRECHADRAGRVVAHAAAALDRRVGSDAVHQLDLRSLETVRRRAEGGASGDAAGHRRIEKEKRPSRRAQDRRSAALRSAAGMLHGAERVSRAAPRPALSKPSGEAGRADEEQTGWPVDGDRRELQQGKTSSEALFRRAAARFPRSSGTHQTSDEGGTRNGRSSRPNRAVAAALPGTRSGSPCARRAFADDSRHWSGHRVDLGVGSRRGRPVFFSEKSGELLRLVQRADRIGRHHQTRADFQATQQASANRVDRSRQDRADLERRSGPGSRESVTERKSQSRHAGGGPQTGGLPAGGGPSRDAVSERTGIRGGCLIATPRTECMDVDRDLPGLAGAGSQQLEETLEGYPQAVSRLAGNPNSIFGEEVFLVKEKLPRPQMDVWFREPRESPPRGPRVIVAPCSIVPRRLFEHVDRATPSALLTLLIMDVQRVGYGKQHAGRVGGHVPRINVVSTGDVRKRIGPQCNGCENQENGADQRRSDSASRHSKVVPFQIVLPELSRI